VFYIINQNQIKLFIKRRPILYKLASKLYNLHPSRLVPQSKQKLEEDAAIFWQKPKAGDLQYEKSHSNHLGARRWDKKNSSSTVNNIMKCISRLFSLANGQRDIKL